MAVELGEVVFAAVKPMLRLYLILGTGFLLTRLGLLGAQTARACSDLVLLVFMPALVFNKIVSYIDISDIKTIGVICFSACVLYGFNLVATTLVVFLTPIPKSPKCRWVGGAYLAGIMQNVSDLPIAYIQAMSMFSLDQQNKGVAYVIIWLAMYVMFQFNLGLSQLVEWDFAYARKHAKDIEKQEPQDKLQQQQQPVNLQPQPQRQVSSKSDLTLSPADLEPEMSYADSEYPTSIDTDESSINDQQQLAVPVVLNDKRLTQRRGSNVSDRVPVSLDKLVHVLSNQSRQHTVLSRIPSARSTYNDSDGGPMADTLSLNQQLVREYSHVEPYNQQMTTTMKIITDNNVPIQEHPKGTFVQKYHLSFLVFFLQNFKKPNAIVLIISLIIALIPWLKALFTNNGTVQLPNAPDKEPALSFILMYSEYMGYPSVPLGVLLIGSTLARLEIGELPKGFWKSALAHTTWRLGILPIIGMVFVWQMKKIGWLTDPMAIFVTSMEFVLPSATVQVYLTAQAMGNGDEEEGTGQLNCLGLYLICQYIVLVVSLPIVACYCIKNVMDF